MLDKMVDLALNMMAFLFCGILIWLYFKEEEDQDEKDS
jgi:hypothetical protein